MGASSRPGAGTLELVFECFGVRACVVANDAAEPARVVDALPPGWRPCPRTGAETTFSIAIDRSGAWELIRDGTVLVRDLKLEAALDLLQTKLRQLVAVRAPRHIFVHAGAVAHNGRLIVIPGRSFAGKTSLVAALVRAGAIYYSDEFAVLDGDGLGHPFAKPLSLRRGLVAQTDHSVESLGGVAGVTPLPVGMVVVTRYRQGAEWNPRQLSVGDALLAVLANSVPAQTRPQQAMRTIARAIRHACLLLDGDRDEADAIAPLLLSQVDRASARA
jgi:hypothetical protein